MAESIAEALEQAHANAPTDRRSVMDRVFTELDTGKTESRNESPDAGKVTWSGERSGEAKDEPVVKTETEEKGVIKDRLPESKVRAAKNADPSGKAVPAKDEKGKFAKSDIKADETGQEVDSQKGKAPRAPVSWKPEARELFSKLPPRVQQEISKREAEITTALNGSAVARKFGQAFYDIIKPHEAIIRASGVSPLQAVHNLVETAAELSTGTKARRAAIVAQLINTYDVDIPTLDALLVGKAAPKTVDPSDKVMESVRAELAPVREFISTVQGRKQQSDQQMQQELEQEHADFAADPENEFFKDVAEEVADMLEVAARRGRKMTLKEAYDRACQSNPDIKKVVDERVEAARTAERAKNYDRSRRATVSTQSGIPGGVGKPGGAPPVGRRSAVAQAYEDLSNG